MKNGSFLSEAPNNHTDPDIAPMVLSIGPFEGSRCRERSWIMGFEAYFLA
jgi:hypothetical protein